MKAFPGFRSWVSGGKLVAEGDVQPSLLSARYRVRIEYAAGEPPEVRVPDPQLVCRPGADRIPHMYKQEILCLYLPCSGEWTPDLPIGHVHVPWISLWLLNYEMWHATGEWLGGGAEPPLNQTIRRGQEATYEGR